MGKENAIKEIIPSYKQGLFLSCPANEILFGGARGPGKTAGLIFDYIKQFLHIHGLAKGVIFRRTFSELEDIIEKCDEFLKPLGFGEGSPFLKGLFPGIGLGFAIFWLFFGCFFSMVRSGQTCTAFFFWLEITSLSMF